jgi:hypothetical protein
MTKQQAHAYLSEATLMNHGPWVGHSKQVAALLNVYMKE